MSVLGVIPLQDAMVAVKDVEKFVFLIHTKNRIFHLQAENVSEMNSWVACLTLVAKPPEEVSDKGAVSLADLQNVVILFKLKVRFFLLIFLGKQL